MISAFCILYLSFTVVSGSFDQPKTPILLVPGVGGSKQYDNYGNKLWVVFNTAEYGANCIANPQCTIITGWKNYGISEVDVLDPELLIGSSETNYFKPIVEHLQNLGYIPGVDLFALPYVWRDAMNNIDVINDLHWFVQGLSPIIITHSMGGLVVEKYLQTYPYASIKKVINLSVPFHGAGGYAIKAFIHGYDLGNRIISSNTDRLVIIAKRFSSTYWLLAKKETIPLTIDGENYIRYLSTKVPGFNITNLAISMEMYRKLRQPLVKNKYIMYRQTTTKTPWAYDTYSKNFTNYVDGDGTVPFMSQSPDYANPDDILTFSGNYDHVGMLDDNQIHSAIAVDLMPCDMAGIYTSGSTSYVLLHTLEKNKYILLDNDIPSNKSWAWYYGCNAIEVDNVKYNREIGNACAEYKVYSEAYIGGYYYQKKCHYGYIRSVVFRVCYKNETYYDPVLDRCYNTTTVEDARQGYLDIKKYQTRKDFLTALNVSLDIPVRIIYVYNQTVQGNNSTKEEIDRYNEKIKEIENSLVSAWKINIILGCIIAVMTIGVIVIFSVKLYRLSRSSKLNTENKYAQVTGLELDSEL